MTSNKRFYSPNMFRVCIDTCHVDISGRAFSPMRAEEIPFVEFGELLVKMDKLFDSTGYPQAFQNKRSFETGYSEGNMYKGIPGMVRNTDTIMNQKGVCCTYDILVISRRNTSWQGLILDTEGEECGKFDGEVELLAALMKLIKDK